MFFFVAGYLMVFSRSIDQLGFVGWAKGKLKKFLVPYVVLTALAYVPKAMLGDTSDAVELSVGYFLRTTFLIPRQGVWGHFWFIATFLVTELYWGLWRAMAKHGSRLAPVLFACGIVACLAMMAWPVYTDFFLVNDLRFHAIFYPLGILLATVKPVLWDKKWKNMLGILLPILPVFLLYPYGNFGQKAWPFANFFVAMGLIWIVWNLAVLVGQRKSRIVDFLVRDSFTVYLYGWPAQAVADVILRRLGVNWLAIIPVLFVVGFAFPLALANGYRRWKVFHCRFLDYLFGVSTNT